MKCKGPIVRINPHEISISDPDYIDEIFTGATKKRDKYRWAQRFSNGQFMALVILCKIDLTVTGVVTESLAATLPHDLHRKRRAALNPYFSKAKVRLLEPVLQKVLVNLLRRLEACHKSGEIMPISCAYRAAAVDVVTAYCFGHSIENLSREDYNRPFQDALHSLFTMSAWFLHLPWLSPLMNALPNSILCALMPGIGDWLQLEQVFPSSNLSSTSNENQQFKSQIENIRDSKDNETGKKTIFHGLLNSDLPESEKLSSRLQQEAAALIGAAQDTTG